MQVDHLTDEQLSALVDGEVTEAERGDLESHLGECTACGARLQALQRTVALVRQLPSVAMPRLFVLTDVQTRAPSAGAAAAPRAARTGALVRPLWLRAAAGLAAALMVVFFFADAIAPKTNTLSLANQAAPAASLDASGRAGSSTESRFSAPTTDSGVAPPAAPEPPPASQSERPAAAILPASARDAGATATPVGPAALQAPALPEASTESARASAAQTQAAPQAPPGPPQERAQRFAQSAPVEAPPAATPPWTRLAAILLGLLAVSLVVTSFLLPRPL